MLSKTLKPHKINFSKDYDLRDLKTMSKKGSFKSFFDTQSKNYPISKYKIKLDENTRI